MLDKLKSIESMIGNTPVRELKVGDVDANIFAKMEFYNFAGSIKTRPAYYILQQAIEANKLDQDSTIIESSSGNFAIALAMLCKLIGIKFVPVIDPNINPAYERLLRFLCKKVIKVTRPDETGGYLLNRIAVVKEILKTRRNIYWTNQYANPNNALSYYHFMGKEIKDSFKTLDYIFIAVSSCGTITGLSKRLKEEFPDIKVIAIDVEGSVIFSPRPQKRYISGIGSSMVPPLLKNAIIDDIMILSQRDIIKGCHELVNKQMVFAGASSGAAYSGIKAYFGLTPPPGKGSNVLFICPDRGDAYLDTVYDNTWAEKVRRGNDLLTV
jgi:N-(2-amino-2-carboxyethyl)-L-glutamate synthase